MDNREILRRSVTLQEQRAFVKIQVIAGISSTEIQRQLNNSLGNEAIRVRTVQDLSKQFREGRTSTEDQRGGDHGNI